MEGRACVTVQIVHHVSLSFPLDPQRFGGNLPQWYHFLMKLGDKLNYLETIKSVPTVSPCRHIQYSLCESTTGKPGKQVHCSKRNTSLCVRFMKIMRFYLPLSLFCVNSLRALSLDNYRSPGLCSLTLFCCDPIVAIGETSINHTHTQKEEKRKKNIHTAEKLLTGAFKDILQTN